MKLLFDQNLSRRLVRRLADVYPDSNHILLLGLDQEPDAVVWQYARDHGYTVVTKDADFSELSVVLGVPPKIIWIKRGNCTTQTIEALLRHHSSQIASLNDHAQIHVLSLP